MKKALNLSYKNIIIFHSNFNQYYFERYFRNDFYAKIKMKKYRIIVEFEYMNPSPLFRGISNST